MNYNDYYTRQVGGALPYFVGSKVQRGHGFGEFVWWFTPKRRAAHWARCGCCR